MSVDQFTEADITYMALAIASDLSIKIDTEKIAAIMGHTNKGSTSNGWNKTKAKILAFSIAIAQKGTAGAITKGTAAITDDGGSGGSPATKTSSRPKRITAGKRKMFGEDDEDDAAAAKKQKTTADATEKKSHKKQEPKPVHFNGFNAKIEAKRTAAAAKLDAEKAGAAHTKVKQSARASSGGTDEDISADLYEGSSEPTETARATSVGTDEDIFADSYEPSSDATKTARGDKDDGAAHKHTKLLASIKEEESDEDTRHGYSAV